MNKKKAIAVVAVLASVFPYSTATDTKSFKITNGTEFFTADCPRVNHDPVYLLSYIDVKEFNKTTFGVRVTCRLDPEAKEFIKAVPKESRTSDWLPLNGDITAAAWTCGGNCILRMVEPKDKNKCFESINVDYVQLLNRDVYKSNKTDCNPRGITVHHIQNFTWVDANLLAVRDQSEKPPQALEKKHSLFGETDPATLVVAFASGLLFAAVIFTIFWICRACFIRIRSKSSRSPSPSTDAGEDEAAA